MISKCIRRLSFRSLAHEDDNKNFAGSNGDLANSSPGMGHGSRAGGDCHFHTPPIPAPMPRKPQNCTHPSSWGSSFWNTFTSSPGSVCGGDLLPRSSPMSRELSFPMHCRVLLKQVGQTFMVTVLLLRADRAMSPANHGQDHDGMEVLAQSMVPRNITPGTVHVKLTSKVFVAEQDVTETSLLKSETNWRGSDVEKQFLLTTNKDGEEALHGLLGTVVVDQAAGDEAGHVFEMHLVRNRSATPVIAASHVTHDDHAWGAAGFRELASILHLVDENEDFEQLAKDLGFTEHELHTKLNPATDSFSALLSTYQSRGGTPQELVRAMYSCSRGRGLGVVGGSPSPLLSTMASQSSLSSLRTLSTPWGELSQDLEDLEEAAKLTTPCSSKRKRKNSSGQESCPMSVKRRCFSPLKPSQEEIEYEDEELDLELCDAATLPVGDLELGIEQSHLPPTPPATPLKRLTDSSRNKDQAADTFLYQ